MQANPVIVVIVFLLAYSAIQYFSMKYSYERALRNVKASHKYKMALKALKQEKLEELERSSTSSKSKSSGKKCVTPTWLLLCLSCLLFKINASRNPYIFRERKTNSQKLHDIQVYTPSKLLLQMYWALQLVSAVHAIWWLNGRYVCWFEIWSMRLYSWMLSWTFMADF